MKSSDQPSLGWLCCEVMIGLDLPTDADVDARFNARTFQSYGGEIRFHTKRLVTSTPSRIRLNDRESVLASIS